MKVTVIDEACIGCGACAASVNEVFKINDNGIAYAISENINENNKNNVINASDSCPTGAIKIEENDL
jgi:ferredoxin